MSDETFLKIEKYLASTMSADEVVEFETEIENDSELAENVRIASQINLHQKGGFEDDFIPKNEYAAKLRTFLKSEEASRLRQELETAKQAYASKKVVPVQRKFPYWIAASIVVLVMCGIGLYFSSQQTPEKLYAAYYSETDLPSVTQRDDTKGNLQKGVAAFKEENFETALTYFKKSQTENTAVAAILYAGMTHVSLGNLEEAITQFDALIESDALDASKGYWFKALAYLKFGEEEKAKNVLLQIKNNSGYFKHSEARELLDEL